MVQRKVPSKLGITQADHKMVNSKPCLATLNPSSLQQNQDVKSSSRGAELKKKMMKKSGKTTKNSEFAAVRKPPPPPKTPPPQRSCPIRASSNATPNYMKSTSSSDARKEQSQVSSKSPPSVCSKTSVKKSSHVSKSGQNPARIFTSLRALTKAPSFKPARASSKKRSLLCEEDLDVQRATCSSTLKDSKFPCFLELNPGATESQGTSAMKVCPYTYCSLNGHHHLPLPPLKCFLSARRRAVKAQRSFKIGCLSPSRARLLNLAGHGSRELESISSDISSAKDEENMEFTIEIYSKGKAEEVKEDRDLSAEEGEDIYQASMAAQEESGIECLSEENHGAVTESMGNQSDSGDSDMEYTALYIDAGAVDLVRHNEEKSDLDVYGSDKKGCYVSQDESTLKAEEDDETSYIIDGILAENMVQESFDEESMSSGAWLSDDDDTQSSISCSDESNFCDYVEESTGCDQESYDSNDFISSENNGTESEQASADEDDVIALAEYQESNDSNDLISSENNEFIITKTSENQNADLEVVSLRRTARDKRETEEEEVKEFNPRGPNFLPLEPDPEAERVGLKHQTMDERKNAEEWMVDYALRQTVSKLGPARRKKVALLVEAFETVSPIPKYESHLRHSSTKIFPPTRSIQACS